MLRRRADTRYCSRRGGRTSSSTTSTRRRRRRSSMRSRRVRRAQRGGGASALTCTLQWGHSWRKGGSKQFLGYGRRRCHQERGGRVRHRYDPDQQCGHSSRQEVRTICAFTRESSLMPWGQLSQYNRQRVGPSLRSPYQGCFLVHEGRLAHLPQAEVRTHREHCECGGIVRYASHQIEFCNGSDSFVF